MFYKPTNEERRRGEFGYAPVQDTVEHARHHEKLLIVFILEVTYM